MVQNVLNSIKEQGKKVSFKSFIESIAKVNREQADLTYGLFRNAYEYTTGETISNEEFNDVYKQVFNPVTALFEIGNKTLSDEKIDMANYQASNKGNTVLKKQEEKGKHIEEEKKKGEQEKREIVEQRQKLEKYKINFKENYEEFRRVLEDNKIDCFYHFTERSNLDNIKKEGGLFSWNFLKKNNIDSIFGGNELSHQLDGELGLEDYVRLSFCEEHPMKFVAVNEGRIKDPVILEIDIEVAFLKGTLFSDMNATKKEHKRGGGVEDLKNVKFDVVKDNFFNLVDSDKAYYQAEILVKTKIPIGYIRNINKF